MHAQTRLAWTKQGSKLTPSKFIVTIYVDYISFFFYLCLLPLRLGIVMVIQQLLRWRILQEIEWRGEGGSVSLCLLVR